MKSSKMMGAGLLVLALEIMGCSTDGRPSLIPNPDPNLQKTSAQFAADAARRSYEEAAPRGGEASARAQYELMSRRVDLVNLSDGDWDNVEVWLNHNYVVYLPKMEKETDKRLDFELFYNRDGHHFDTDGGRNPVKELEVFRDGKMYTVRTVLE